MSNVIGRKRGPKSEKEVFYNTATTLLRGMNPNLSDSDLQAQVDAQGEKHEREKETIRRSSKVQTKLAKNAEMFMLACKAFGPFQVRNDREKGENRDLSRIEDAFGNFRQKGREIFCGDLPVGQNLAAFAPDGHLRKFADFLYAWGSSNSESIREGSGNRKALETLVNQLIDLGLDGREVSKRLQPAIVRGLETMSEYLESLNNDDLVEDSEDSEDIAE